MSRNKLAAHEHRPDLNPTVEDLLAVSKYFNISIDHLLLRDLSEEPNQPPPRPKPLRVLVTTVDRDNRDNIEVVSTKAAAGYLTGYGDPEFISTLDTCSLPYLPKGRKYRMFQTTGDSMDPFPENCYIVGEYIPEISTLKPDTLCIVVTTDGVVFKSASIRAEKSLILKSLNPNYAPFTVKLEEVLEIWRFKSYISDKTPETNITAMLNDMHRDIKTIVNRLEKSPPKQL